MWDIGVGRGDVTGFVRGVGMMGWGTPHQRVDRVAEPLQARAFVLHDPVGGRRLALVVAEICFVTTAVRQAVLERLAMEHRDLAIGEHDLLVVATHTHSGPGGYSHHLLYDLTIPGFVEEVHAAIVRGIVEAIVAAARSARPGHVRVACGPIPASQRVAFNRSPASWNRNPEAAEAGPPATRETAHLAIDRTMTVLRFEDGDGAPRGALAWFGVHGTSIHADHAVIHPDNKGFAATAFEAHAARAWGRPDFVAAFAQRPCGDVSPNFRYDRRRGFVVGAFDDDFESARFNGEIQLRQARRLFDEAAGNAPLAGRLRGRVHYADHGDVLVDPAFAGGHPDRRTGPPTMSVSMMAGTAEGPGPYYPVRRVLWGLNQAAGWVKRLRRDRWSDPFGPRFVFVDAGRGRRGRVFGIIPQGPPPLPDAVDPAVAYLRRLDRTGALGDEPWIPCVLPAQILALGPLAIVAVPGEPTTVAGWRLAATAREALRPIGVDHVEIAPYANAYAGYVTTPEEYERQVYEGGSTAFGRWTLAAWQTRYAALARDLAAAPDAAEAPTGDRPWVATAEEVAGRLWEPEATR